MSKILVIEDEPAIADLIKMELELQGYRCKVAHDREDGTDLLEKDTFDLILLEKVDGYELLEYIKQIVFNMEDAILERRQRIARSGISQLD